MEVGYKFLKQGEMQAMKAVAWHGGGKGGRGSMGR